MSRGDTCRRVSSAHDDDQGADDIHSGRDTFTPLHAEVTKKLTKFFWWLKKVLIVTVWPITLILDEINLTTQTPPLHVSVKPPRRRLSKVCVSKKTVQGICLFLYGVANTISIALMIVLSWHFFKAPILIKTSFRWLRAEYHNGSNCICTELQCRIAVTSRFRILGIHGVLL